MVFLLIAAACGGIPDSGPIHEVKAADGSGESTVRYSPAGPTKNATPQQIVRGYLDAMLAYPVTTGIAAQFLTPDAAKGWKSASGVQVYVRPRVARPTSRELPDAAGSAYVGLTVHQTAQLDGQGNYVRGGTDQTFSFELAKNDGQWRIANPPPGFLVDQKYFDDYYRPFNDYFFDQSGRRLVARPIYVPIGDQLTTALLSSLLVGPGDLLDGHARSYMPKAAKLRTSVPLRGDGVAEIELRADLSALSASARERLSAQVAWTLNQVDSISGIRVTDGESFLYTGNQGILPKEFGQSYGPKFGPDEFFAVAKNHVVKVNGTEIAPVEGTWGEDSRGATALAVSDRHEIAAVTTGRTQLLLGALRSKQIVNFSGKELLPPRWDDQGDLWAFDRQQGATRVRLMAGKKFRTLAVGKLAALNVRSFALSPDNSRYAVITGKDAKSTVLVGSIIRDSADVPVGLSTPVSVVTADAQLSNFRSVAWSDDTNVAFLANDRIVGAQIFRARIDGSDLQGGTSTNGALLPSLDAAQLATPGGTSASNYLLDAKGRLWLLRPQLAWSALTVNDVVALAAVTTLSTD